MGNDMESNGTMNKCKGVGCLQRQWHHDYIIQNSQACAKDLYKNKSFRKSVTCLPKIYTELYAIYNIYTKRENRKYNKTFSKTPQQKVFGGKDLCQLIDLQFLQGRNGCYSLRCLFCMYQNTIIHPTSVYMNSTFRISINI